MIMNIDGKANFQLANFALTKDDKLFFTDVNNDEFEVIINKASVDFMKEILEAASEGDMNSVFSPFNYFCCRINTDDDSVMLFDKNYFFEGKELFN